MVSFFGDGFEPYERIPLTREECLRYYGVIIEKDGELIDPRDFYAQTEEGDHLIIIPKAMHDDIKRWSEPKQAKAPRRHHPVPETPRSPRGSKR